MLACCMLSDIYTCHQSHTVFVIRSKAMPIGSAPHAESGSEMERYVNDSPLASSPCTYVPHFKEDSIVPRLLWRENGVYSPPLQETGYETSKDKIMQI